MPVYVMGLTTSQTPFSFGNTLPSLVFHWSTTKRDILDVQSRHSEVGTTALFVLTVKHITYFLTYFSDMPSCDPLPCPAPSPPPGPTSTCPRSITLPMRVTGRTRGRTGPQGGAEGHRHGQERASWRDAFRELSDEVQIQGKSISISIAMTNRDGMSGLSYRVLECPDQAAPVALAQADFGINQTLASALKSGVVPVSYLRFSTSPPLHTAASSRETLAAIPLGAVLTFTVHFHASTGETLHSSSSLLTFSTNSSRTRPASCPLLPMSVTLSTTLRPVRPLVRPVTRMAKLCSGDRMSLLVVDQWKTRLGSVLPKEKGV
ncbi:hypothetical protein CRUP_012781 [Coryphaenoides rupestris]|nr:hypothetical protein CRUP_012781 [Coryphaenoides rupestris]